MPAHPHRLSFLAAAIAILALAAAHANDQQLWLVNESPSAPRGLYQHAGEPGEAGLYARVRSVDVAPNYVAQRSPADARFHFLKRIAATEGEFVCAEIGGVIVNHVRLPRALRDREGRTLPQWVGCRRLRAGEVFLIGDGPNSFDSRYWGPVSSNLVLDLWRPLFAAPTSP